MRAKIEFPWHLNALLLSRPIHFGDYGGLPLKIIWAILDVISIVLLASGLYLWTVKRPGRLESSGRNSRRRGLS